MKKHCPLGRPERPKPTETLHLPTFCWLSLVLLSLLSTVSGAWATVYDFRTPFDISEWDGIQNSVSGSYEDLRITCTDNDTSYPMPSAGTDTASGTLYWYGSGWSYSSANVLLAIAKADGRPFTPNSVKINYHTYSPHYVPGTYQGGTIRITAYVGASAVGTWSYYYDGSGNSAGYSTTVNFAGLSGFQNITSLVFDNDRQDLSIQNLVMDSVANTTPSFVDSTTTLTVNQNSLANDVRGLLHVSDADATQTLTWTQNSPPANGQLSIVNASATTGATDIAPGGTISYTPTEGYFGPDSFSVRVSDGTASATRTITVNVVDNTPPGVMISLPSVILTRSGPVNFTVSYADPNLDGSSISIDPEDVVLHRTGTVTVGEVVISGTGTSRQISLSGLAGDGTVSVSLNAGTAADTVGNVADSAGPSSAATVDNTAPVISSAPVWNATYDQFSLYRITALGEPAIYGGSGEPAWLLIDQVTGWLRGTPAQSGTFTFTITATDHAGNVGSANLSLQVQKATPFVMVWPVPSGLVYGEQLSASVLSGGSATVPGSFSFQDPVTTPSAGLYAAAVKFIPTDSDNYETTQGMVTVEVSRATPAVTVWPSASWITYGDQLAASVLTGGTASQAGSFSFETPWTVPDAGTYSAGVRFTPADTGNYNTVQGTIVVQVDRATPVVTMWPSASGITYGEQLSASVLSGGTASAAGSFSFDAPATAPGAGTYTAAVRFLPADPDNYTAVDGAVIVNVSRATPIVLAWPTASAITYGEQLSASKLSEGTASVEGTFAFDSPVTTPSAGTHMATVRFTPADTDNYHVVDGIITIAVSRANPVVILWPTANAITYGDQLSASVLTGGAGSVAGTFSFESPATAPNAGTYTADVRFIPTDSDNYNEVGGTITVNVIRATPVVTTWPTADSITYGDPLSASVLSPGAASVPGSFSFDHPATTPSAGIVSAAVTFTPSDADNYSPVNGTVPVNVDRATPVVTAWPNSSGITYGDQLSASLLSGGTASVPGSFSFDVPSTAPLAGQYMAAVSFAPSDTVNYNPVNGTVPVNVGRATPVVTAWPAASGIIYGDQLAASALGGGVATVAGSFSFDHPATTPDAGILAAAVTFTPTDTDNYNLVNGTVPLKVDRATPVVTAWPAASGITYGDELSASLLSDGTASVVGSFSFDSPTTAPSAGTYTAAVTFAPTDTENYNLVNGTVVVEVDRATPAVTAWPTAGDITYGDQLSASLLIGGTASVAGGFSFEAPASAPNAGSYSASIAFTPTDSGNFKDVRGSVRVHVEKAALELKADDVARRYGQQNPEWKLTCTGFVNADELDSLEGELQTSFETLEGQTVPDVTTATPVGSYQIWPAGLSSDNYQITFVPGLLEIVPAELTVSCRNVRREYGIANPALGVDITGYVNGEGSEVLSGELQISSAAAKESPVGTYPIVASGVSCPNYTITFVGGALTVSPASLLLVAHDAVRVYGDPEPVFQATLTGVLNGDRLPVVFATTASRYSPVGTYAIVPSFEDPDHKLRNYTMSIFSAELRVTARKLTAMAHNLCRVAGQMNPVLTGTLEGALPDDGITVHYSTSASISSATGRYAIEPVLSGPQSKLENYSVNLVPGALIVVPPIRMSGSNLVCVLGSGPAPVDEQVSVENSPGFDFEGMQLTVTVAAPEAGSIEARSASDNTNGLKISDGRLLFKGSVFGSADNNAGPDSVQFTFTAGAIAPAVEALLQALVFSTDTYGSGSRVIEITISFGESHVRYVRGVEINRPPVAEPDTILAVANTSFMITEDELLGNDLDSDGDVLTLRPGVSVGTNGATLTIGSGMLAYTPGPKQDAEEEFSCTVEDGRGASCLVTVKFRFIQRHRIIMSSADVDDHGTRVFMAGTPEGEYDIEASADLANWRPIDTLKASSTGIIEVRDSQSAGLPQRFYRAVAK